MKIEFDTQTVPRAALSGSQVKIRKANCLISELTVSELSDLMTFWMFNVLSDLTQPREMIPIFYSRKELAEILKLSTTIIDELIHSGQLPAKYISKRPIILHSDLMEYIQKNVFTAVRKEDSEPGDTDIESIEFSQT